MNKVQVAHPGPELLSDFSRGALGDAESAAIEQHLGNCPLCREALGRIAPDALASLLRRAPVQPAAATKDSGPEQTNAPGHDTPRREDIPPELAAHSRYRIVEILGRGGMGAVFKAEHRLMQRTVALKMIRSDLVDRPGTIERFRREVKAAAQLNHPNIVAALDAEQAAGVHFLVMEYIEGTNLADVVKQAGPFSVQQACNFARQTALGLQHAFERGMIHRDIKPHNLLRTPSGWIKILDFGLARFVRESGALSTEPGGLTQSGSIMGTPDYMAPEQADDPHTADIRADLYSLGCTLYFLLAGHPPFPKGTVVEKLAAHHRDTPRPLYQFRRDVPPELSALVARLLSKKPDERFQTPAEVAQALTPFLRPPATRPSAPRPPRRRRWAIVGGALLFLLLLSAAAVYRIATDKGELVIMTDAEDVEVIVKQKGKEVAILDLRTEQKIELHSGEYVAELGKGGEGLVISSKDITIKRGEKTIVQVHLEPAKPGEARLTASPPGPADKLRAEDIPAYELAMAGGGDPKQAPPGLVAILGDSRMKHWHEVWDVAFSPDGKIVASCSEDRTVKLWDAATGDELHTLSSHALQVEAVAFSPDGKTLASASLDATAKLWDVASGALRKTLVGHRAGICHLAFSPDGRTLATAGGYLEDAAVKLWDIATGECVRTLKHGEGILGVAYSPDGELLATGSHLGVIRIWQSSTGQLLQTLKSHRGQGWHGLAFHPKKPLLVSGGEDHTVKVWNTTTWQEERTNQEHSAYVTAAAFSRDGERLATASMDGTVILWDGTGRKEQRRLTGPRTERLRALSFSRDGQTLALGGSDSTVKLWDLRTDQLRALPKENLYIVYGVAVSPDGRTLAWGGYDYKVHLWDLAERKECHVFGPYPSGVASLSFSPDGRWLAWAGWENDLHLGNLANYQESRLRGHTEVVTRVQFSPDSRMLASAGFGRTVKLWDVLQRRELHTLSGHTENVNGVAFSPDGKLLTTAGADKTIRLWDTATGNEKRVVEGHLGQVRAVAFRPDGRVLASTSVDATVRLWDVSTYKELHVLRIDAAQDNLAFSPDGQTLAVAGWDGKVRLWDAYSGAAGPILTLGPPGGLIMSLAFTPDGRHLVTGNYNGTIYVLRLAPPRN